MFIELQQPPPPTAAWGIAVQTWYPPRSKFATVADQALDAVLAQIGNRYQSLHS
jgi:hypothetical protein